MKTFFASFLGTLVAVAVLILGAGAVLFGLIFAAAAFSEPRAAAVTPGSYLVFDLRMNITEAPTQFDDSAFTAALSGSDLPGQLQHRLVVRALHEAATDDRIEGVVIKGSFTPSGFGTSFASLQEIRRALAAVKAEGKPIKAYLEYPDLRDYYIASLADDIALDPNGGLFMPGLASQPTFYAGAFEKYGIGVQVARAGKFKSAVEPFTMKQLSPENREQLQRILNDLWTEMRDEIAHSRGMEPQVLQQHIDEGSTFLAEDLEALGLIDRLVYLDVFLEEIKEATGRAQSTRPFKQVALRDYIKQISQVAAGVEAEPVESGSESGRVGVVFAEGAIVDGEGRFDQVGGARFARAIREFRQDDDIKALVLRVNSPGGSVMGSDQIRRELSLVAADIPVVVSMGGYAASGGYWISAQGDKIYAEPTTITGSIGVYGMLLNIEELGDDLGVTWDTVKTGEFADAMTIARPKTEQEMAIIQRGVVDIYDDFIDLVAEGRGMDAARVKELAQGRVWSGIAAKEVGLVDEIGGLADAIAAAAEMANLDAGFRLTEFPRKRDLADAINEALSSLQSRVQGGGVLQQVAQPLQELTSDLEAFNDPRGIYARMPLELEP
jgi:protease IV